MSIISARVEIDPNMITNKIARLLDDDCKMEINQMFAEMVDPYVPYISGDLAHSVNVTPQGLQYTMPYARRVYYGENPHNTNIHPLASSYWDRVTMDNHYDEFESKVKEILKRRAKELYG